MGGYIKITLGCAIFAALGLAGCATTGEVMQRAPADKLASTASPAQVVSCIAPRVLKDWGQSKVSPNGDGSMIVVSGSAWGNPIAVIDVSPATKGTQIMIRRGNASDHVFGSIAQTVRICS